MRYTHPDGLNIVIRNLNRWGKYLTNTSAHHFIFAKSITVR